MSRESFHLLFWAFGVFAVILVDEIPKLGSGKTDFGATKKIALVNDQ